MTDNSTVINLQVYVVGYPVKDNVGNLYWGISIPQYELLSETSTESMDEFKEETKKLLLSSMDDIVKTNIVSRKNLDIMTIAKESEAMLQKMEDCAFSCAVRPDRNRKIITTTASIQFVVSVDV